MVAAEEGQGAYSGHILLAQPARPATPPYAGVTVQEATQAGSLPAPSWPAPTGSHEGQVLAERLPSRPEAPPIAARPRALLWQPRPASESRGPAPELGLQASVSGCSRGLGISVTAIGVAGVLLPRAPSQEAVCRGRRQQKIQSIPLTLSKHFTSSRC